MSRPWARVIVADTDPPGLNGHNGLTVLTRHGPSRRLRRWLRARQLVNLANGSTLAGAGRGRPGGAQVARSADGLFIGTGYRLPVPPAPAFCLGNVILTRGRGHRPRLAAVPARGAGTPPSSPGAAGWRWSRCTSRRRACPGR